jgi:hypothetical protein
MYDTNEDSYVIIGSQLSRTRRLRSRSSSWTTRSTTACPLTPISCRSIRTFPSTRPSSCSSRRATKSSSSGIASRSSGPCCSRSQMPSGSRYLQFDQSSKTKASVPEYLKQPSVTTSSKCWPKTTFNATASVLWRSRTTALPPKWS